MSAGARILEIDYSEMESAAKAAKKLSEELEDYAKALSDKVQSKINDVKGGSSAHLSNANYYINRKISDLNKKSQCAVSISTKISNVVTVAQQKDAEVAKSISSAREVLFGKHNDLVPNKVKQAWIGFLENLKNLPVLGWIVKAGEKISQWATELKHAVHEWWHYGGGKEIFDIVVKVGAAVVAVAAVVAAIVTGAAFVVIAASIVLAVIAVADAICNTVSEVHAMRLKESKNYTLAAVHSGRDSAAQLLREHDFDDRGWNRFSYGAAAAIELTEVAASVVVLVAGIGESVGKFLDNKHVGFAFKEMVRGADGKMTQKYTLKSVWNGTKALFTNSPVGTHKKGLWTALKTNAGWTKESLLKSPKIWGKQFLEICKHPVLYYKQMHPKPTTKADKVEMVVDVIKGINSGVSSTGKIIEGFANGDSPAVGKTLASIGGSAVKNFYFSGSNRPFEYNKNIGKYTNTRDHFFDASLFSNLIGATGIGGLEENLDKIGVLGKTTGMDDTGFIQHGQKIAESIKGFSVPHEPVNVTGIEGAKSFDEKLQGITNKMAREAAVSNAGTNVPRKTAAVSQRTYGAYVTPLAFNDAYPYLAAVH